MLSISGHLPRLGQGVWGGYILPKVFAHALGIGEGLLFPLPSSQDDGNVVVYNTEGTPLWATHTEQTGVLEPIAESAIEETKDWSYSFAASFSAMIYILPTADFKLYLIGGLPPPSSPITV